MMLAHRKQRLMIVLFILVGSALAVALTLFAFNQGINVFYTPTEIAEGKVPEGQSIRIGGMVKEGSVRRDGGEGTHIEFLTTDTNVDIPVSYTGVLPDLFREGQGVVADGRMVGGVFEADRILAKHDENYMSAEVMAALEAAGRNPAATGATGAPQ